MEIVRGRGRQRGPAVGAPPRWPAGDPAGGRKKPAAQHVVPGRPSVPKLLVARIVSYGCWRADPAVHHGARMRTLAERRRARARKGEGMKGAVRAPLLPPFTETDVNRSRLHNITHLAGGSKIRPLMRRRPVWRGCGPHRKPTSTGGRLTMWPRQPHSWRWREPPGDDVAVRFALRAPPGR